MREEAVGIVRIRKNGYETTCKVLSLWRAEGKHGFTSLLRGFDEGSKVRVIIEAISGGLFQEMIR